jgi:flagellar basal-body rod protein FlgB
LPLLEQVVKFTEARHGVLAGNIANLDTPGYRCQDLSPETFQKQLREAVQAKQRGRNASPGESMDPEWARDAALDSARNRGVERMRTAAESARGMLRHDDNNASLEEQVTEIAKNQSQHNLALGLMRAQFSLLRAAITERA